MRRQRQYGTYVSISFSVDLFAQTQIFSASGYNFTLVLFFHLVEMRARGVLWSRVPMIEFTPNFLFFFLFFIRSPFFFVFLVDAFDLNQFIF